MTFWTPARTESLQAPPQWKCGGISNISHWQKDLTAGVHTQARLLFFFFNIYIYISVSLSFFAPHKFRSCQIGSKACRLQMYSFYSIANFSAWRYALAWKKRAWLEIWNSTDFPDVLLYVSNQLLNVNVSLAPVGVIGPKCLKCPLSAPLSYSVFLSSDFVADVYAEDTTLRLVQLIEPICCRLLPLSPAPIR